MATLSLWSLVTRLSIFLPVSAPSSCAQHASLSLIHRAGSTIELWSAYKSERGNKHNIAFLKSSAPAHLNVGTVYCHDEWMRGGATFHVRP